MCVLNSILNEKLNFEQHICTMTHIPNVLRF